MATIDRRSSLASEVALAIKAPALVATTANITLSGIQVIDGVTVGNSNERVLVKNQTDTTQNGIYLANSGNWTLAPDAQGNTDWANGTSVAVASGVANGGIIYIQTGTDSPIVIGTSHLTFVAQTLSGAALSLVNSAPGFNYASGLLGALAISNFNGQTVTVPATKTFSMLRFSNSDGSDIVFIGKGTNSAAPIYSSVAASASCDSTFSVYGAVLHATNFGPATTRGAHLGGFGAIGSTGAISAAGAQIQPVATNSGAYGIFASLTSSGVHDLAVAYAIESGVVASGDRYLCGVLGGGVNKLPIGSAFIQWNDSTLSSAGALFLRVFNPSNVDVFHVDKSGNVLAQNAGFGYAAAGLTASENVTVKGFVAVGTASGVVGEFGDTGAGEVVIGSYSNHAIGIRTNNVVIGRLYASGGLSLASSPADPGAQNLSVGGVYKVGTNQVVAARQTGWTVMTGTPQRGTFTTGGVTLAQLAGVVMALEQDLIAHGLIGT